MKNKISLSTIIIYLTYSIISLSEFLLLLRIILKLFGANASTPFVVWTYDTTNVLLSPFRGIFPTETIARSYTLDFSAMFALIVYALVAYFIGIILDRVDNQ